MQVNKFEDDKKDHWFIKLAVNKSALGVMCRETDWKFGTHFTGKIDYQNKHFFLKTPKAMDIFSFQNKLKEHDGKIFVATAQHNQKIFGVHFKIVGISAEGVICSFPEEVYEINRRQSKRFKIPNIQKAQLILELVIPKFSMVAIQMPVSDISIHGVGFKVPERYKHLFVQNQMIPVANIKLNGKNLTAALEIRNMFPNPAEPMFPYKIGARFLKIDNFYQLEIQKYISEFESVA